jgi:hypothetical protein
LHAHNQGSREIKRESRRQTDKQTDTQTDKQRDRDTDRERERDKQRDRQTDRQTERETERQREREREADRERETEREKRECVCVCVCVQKRTVFSFVRVCTDRVARAHREDSASPRKPKEEMPCRSLKALSLDVQCLRASDSKLLPSMPGKGEGNDGGIVGVLGVL